MKKKVEVIRCTSLGSYLADPSPENPANLARFILEVSPKAYGSLDPPSSDPDPAPMPGDWNPVNTRISNMNPIQETSMTEDMLRSIIQTGDRTIRLLVDENIKSYRIIALCSQCPAVENWWVAASGSFEV